MFCNFGDKNLLLSESAWDKPSARVCPVCCVCHLSKIATLHKSPANFSSWHQAGDQIRARSWMWHQKYLEMGTRTCLRSLPLLQSAPHGEDRMESSLCPLQTTGTHGRGDRRTSWRNEQKKSLSEPPPFLNSQPVQCDPARIKKSREGP